MGGTAAATAPPPPSRAPPSPAARSWTSPAEQLPEQPAVDARRWIRPLQTRSRERGRGLGRGLIAILGIPRERLEQHALHRFGKVELRARSADRNRLAAQTRD